MAESEEEQNVFFFLILPRPSLPNTLPSLLLPLTLSRPGGDVERDETYEKAETAAAAGPSEVAGGRIISLLLMSSTPLGVRSGGGAGGRWGGGG